MCVSSNIPYYDIPPTGAPRSQSKTRTIVSEGEYRAVSVFVFVFMLVLVFMLVGVNAFVLVSMLVFVSMLVLVSML